MKVYRFYFTLETICPLGLQVLVMNVDSGKGGFGSVVISHCHLFPAGLETVRVLTSTPNSCPVPGYSFLGTARAVHQEWKCCPAILQDPLRWSQWATQPSYEV